MALELITGRYGTAHIGSEDVRAYQAYTAGSGRYVLHGGGATIQSANDVHLNPAEILIDGAHVRITGQGEDVTLENGASSYNRVDIVALHYLMTGSGDAAVESITLEVVKGTPSELTPSDPSMPASGSILDNVSETYVPYVRVLIQGLTPQEPEVLLPDYVNPSDIAGGGKQVNPSVLVNLGSSGADTIFKAEPRPGVYGTLPASKGGTGQTSLRAARNAMGLGNTTGALPIANGGTGATSAAGARNALNLDVNVLYNSDPWYVYENAGYIYVVARGVKTGSGSWDSTACPYTIPSGKRPIIEVLAPVMTSNGVSTTGCIGVATDGEIYVRNNGSAGSTDNRYGVLMWPSNGM